MIKHLPINARDRGDMCSIAESEGYPGGGNAPYSSIFAWEISWTEEPGGLWSMGSRRAGRDWATKQQHHLPKGILAPILASD